MGGKKGKPGRQATNAIRLFLLLLQRWSFGIRDFGITYSILDCLGGNPVAVSEPKISWFFQGK